jgi:methyl-accepting chemotaxis protein
MPKLPRLTIAAKLYSIFSLLAIATLALAVVTVMNARRHASLTGEFEAAFLGLQNVERVNGLIYAVVMESRGIYMSPDIPSARRYGNLLLQFNERIASVVQDWRRSVVAEDAKQFDEFSRRIQQLIDFRKELVRRGTEINPAAGREWGDNEANRSVRTALNRDLDALSQRYDARAKQLYAQLEQGIQATAWLTTAFGTAALMLAAIGAIIIWRAITQPLGRITWVTEQVATGAKDIPIPHTERRDEIGALARSISVFRETMRRNEELHRSLEVEARAREQRNRDIDAAVDSFRISVDQIVRSIGQSAVAMRNTASSLTGIAGRAASEAHAASGASGDTSSNVQTVASAAEELSASIQEISRQVAQATQVVRSAGTTTESSAAQIETLADASQKIGAVVDLIQAIAAQTNLLALNATIEAARAGDAGKGFAVVAQEVKSLASQTAKATEEIAQHISGIQGSTKTVVETIREVAASMRQIDQVTAAIAGAIEEQGAATREISHNAQLAARGTQALSVNITTLTGALGDTNGSAQAVISISADVSSQAETLNQEVQAFFHALRTGSGDPDGREVGSQRRGAA